MDTTLTDLLPHATPERSQELLTEGESANVAVELAEKAEAEATDAEQRAAQTDRDLSKQLANAKADLQTAEAAALDAATEGSETFADETDKHTALVAQVALLQHARERHRVYAMLDARRATLVAQRDLAQAQKHSVHLSYDHLINELLIIAKQAGSLTGVVTLYEQAFSSGRAGQLRNHIIRLSDLESGFQKAIEKHDIEAEERRAAFRRERRAA